MQRSVTTTFLHFANYKAVGEFEDVSPAQKFIFGSVDRQRFRVLR